MTSFDKTWARQETQSVTGKLREAVKPQGALKPRIQTAVNKLQVQISKMDSMTGKLQERDQQIFKRIVNAMQQHDTSTSKVLSNELAEIRKVSRMLGNARMSLEQVQLRLTTIHDLGDAFNMESDATSEETEKILQEASAVAEQQIGDKFPSVPSLEGLSSPSTQSTSTSSTYE